MVDDVKTPPADKPWYEGADADTVGYLQNRGWVAKPANEVALEAIKAHRSAEKLIGAPADRIIRLPSDANDETGWAGVWQKLGAPVDAKGYDFSTIKNSDGSALDAKLTQSIQEAAAAAKVPLPMAQRMAQAVAKHLEDTNKSSAVETATKLAESQAALRKNWGSNFEVNKVIAQQAAKALGATPEQVSALESVVGYDRVMEMFRTIGSKIGEDKLFTGNGPAGNIMTKDMAVSRKNDLKADQAWVGRYLAGGAPEKAEMLALDRIIVETGA